jgi:DNA invertase Pin-like site-specific DNA recombinase
MEQKFFLYARKSTDVEDKQVLSIEAQLTELRMFAKQENLFIAEEFVEKQSAKIPGRPIFNSMMNKIERGEATGIVTWNPDRLARNSVDGGKIIYLLDCERMTALKSPQFWFENTPQGKFMLNIAFGQSKYYVDALSENTKRGMRQKVRKGEYPGLAPIGYLNDVRTKTIMVDRKRSLIIRQAFELYAENNSCLEAIALFLAKHGITSSFGNPLKKDRISYILSNPFYTGFFRYGKELYEGKHQPIITKQLFDKVQDVLKGRSRVHHTVTKEPRALCGLLSCGTCGMMITGEHHLKRERNGNVHRYTYYRCTKKSKTINCKETYVREEKLDEQISKLLSDMALPSEWIEELRGKLEQDRREASASSKSLQGDTEQTIRDIQTKVERLLDGYLAQDIEREVYLKKKADLLSQKKSLEEKRTRLEHTANAWLEPMEKWLNDGEKLKKIAQASDLFAKKVTAKEIFGSNLLLTQENVVVVYPENVVNVVGKNVVNPSGNVVVVRKNVDQNVVGGGIKQQWAAVKAARSMASEKPSSFVMARRAGNELSFARTLRGFREGF